MKSFSLGLAALLPLLSLGCSIEELEPGTKLDSLRVLAQRADQPYAHPGETVSLNALSFDPQDRPLTWGWASCVNPSSNDLQGCFDRIAENPDPASSVFALGPDLDSPSLTIPSDALANVPVPARSAASIGIVSAACPGDLTIADGIGGLPFTCRETGTGRELGLHEFIVGIKRLTLRETERNQNPEIASVTFDGGDWPEDDVKEVGFCDQNDFIYDTCPDAEKHQLAVHLTPESYESGTDELGHTFNEQLIINYYATEGIFENEVRIGSDPKDGWVARKSASGQTLQLWFVARDNRGGVTWAQRRVKVR